MRYLTTAFSPNMLTPGNKATIREVSLEDSKMFLDTPFTSAVGHEVTAKILEALLERPVAFNRSNLTLLEGDEVLTVIPSFRATEAREFTKEEVMQHPFRCFLAEIAEE